MNPMPREDTSSPRERLLRKLKKRNNFFLKTKNASYLYRPQQGVMARNDLGFILWNNNEEKTMNYNLVTNNLILNLRLLDTCYF